MATREEKTLDRYIPKEVRKACDNNEIVLDYITALEVMREYAREMSIGAMGWVLNNKEYDFGNENRWHKRGTPLSEDITTDQLFDKYLEHLSTPPKQ